MKRTDKTKMDIIRCLLVSAVLLPWSAPPCDAAEDQRVGFLTEAPPRGVPEWMDEYVTGNPSLLPWLPHPRVAVPVKRLTWSHNGTCPKGFPEMWPETSVDVWEIKMDRLPHDAVRSPGFRFVFLPCRYCEIGTSHGDGDDGMNALIGDLRNGRVGSLYFAGLYSAWPMAATWFTDRYLLVSGIAPPEASVFAHPPDPDDPADRFRIEVRLFDFLRGESWVTILDTAPDASEPTFIEKICLPPDPGNPDAPTRDGPWGILWQTVQAGIEAKAGPPPVSVAEAALQAGQTPPADTAWLALGRWPSVESWQLAREDGTEKPRPPGEPTDDPLLSSRPGGGETRIHTLAIHGTGDPTLPFTTDSDPVAFADILTTGSGSMPRLAAVRRLGSQGELLLLAGSAPAPGLHPGPDTHWLLLIDNQRHQAWAAWWDGEAAE